MKILILESDLKLRNELAKFFIAEHYEVLATESPKQAEAYINNIKEEIDIVLCDLDKPKEGSLDFVKYLQQQTDKIPFVVLATSENSHSIVNKLQRGLWSYIVKPILNFKTLLITIEQLCHQQHLITANTLYKDELLDKHKELEQDHIAGSKIHKQLLPINNTDILNLNFSYFLYPSLYISGDFIDYQQLSDRYAIFYLSDVSGHGVSSAFVTVLVKACIQQYCSEFMHMDNNTAIDPKAMLSTLNKVVCSESLGKYLTMVYMVYDQKLSKITYSVAGHFPFPVYIQEGTKAQYIGERGYPIGMFSEATFENYQLELAENFKIAIFSDGLMEVIPQQELEAKEQSIIEILTEHHHQNLESIQELLSIDPSTDLPDDVCGLFVSTIK